MVKSLKGTQTEKNLLISFAGESQARNRYTFFASKAKKEGYVQISQIFEETAAQEKEHGERFFKFLEGCDLQITASFPAGMIRTTLENLQEAAMGEYHEASDMYPEFAKTADEEGFGEIAEVFRAVSVAERYHELRFKELAENIKMDRVFKRPQKVTWRCLNCGYIHEGESAPEICPACAHAQSYFALICRNW